ncbi:hypothetical protein D3C76_1806190 [compost metagenome]
MPRPIPEWPELYLAHPESAISFQSLRGMTPGSPNCWLPCSEDQDPEWQTARERSSCIESGYSPDDSLCESL